ncbi:MAG: hypothetical protein WBV21_05940 [Desulfobacterales bacterium]
MPVCRLKRQRQISWPRHRSLALQQMLLKDVQRLFVYKDDPARIVGVLSLSDSARFRSGSCRACTSGRQIVGV